MVDWVGFLPLPKNSGLGGKGDDIDKDVTGETWYKDRMEALRPQTEVRFKEPPRYGKRQGFVPRRLEDFGDGGAFPEIHFPQYPLNMGRKENQGNSTSVLPTTVDGDGQVRFDAIVKQGENANKIVHAQHRDMVPKLPNEVAKFRATAEEIEESTIRTNAKLQSVVHERLAAAQPKNVPTASTGASYVKYTPSQQLAAFNSGAQERTIKLVEMPVDPLEPPKFKHKRVPRASGSPPVPIMHSPPRPVTVQDQQEWKIPPCISNWKNPKGYTIPLDKRLAADGRGLQEVQINDNFAKLSEALYTAEQKARESVELRAKVQKEYHLKLKEGKEKELRELASRVRVERAGVNAERGRMEEDPEERSERQKRDHIREDRKRERDRERRLEAKEAASGKKSKLTRDRDRDITEKVALGMANVKSSGEVVYDQRLFNQDQGMDSGYGADDAYNVYDKGLFTSHPSLSLHRPKKEADSDMYGGDADEQMEQLKSDRFRPDKGFAGATEKRSTRDRPVEFEKEDDPFGLNDFLTKVKSGKKDNKESGGGTMRASGGSGPRDAYEGSSSRSRVDFERGKGK